jgi:tetratricopeptide (TPR) repeat protein
MRHRLPKLKAVRPGLGAVVACLGMLHFAQLACPGALAQDFDSTPRGICGRAEFEWNHGQRRRAIDIVTDLLLHNPDLDNDVRSYALQKRCWYHWNMGEKDQALRDVRAGCAIEAPPSQYASVHISAAYIENALGLYRDAERDATIALKSGGLDTPARVDEAKSLIAKTQELREQDSNKSSAASPGKEAAVAPTAPANQSIDPDQAIKQAQKLADAHKFSEALELINHVFTSHALSEASCVRALFLRSGIYLQQNRYQQAIPDYDRILISKLAQQGTWHTEALIGRGEAKFRLGQSQQALKDLTDAQCQALSLPQLERANLAAMIGFASYASGDLKTACEHFTKALDLEPQAAFAPVCMLYRARCDRKMSGETEPIVQPQPEKTKHESAPEKSVASVEKKPEATMDKKPVIAREAEIPHASTRAQASTGALAMDSMLAQQVKDYDSLLQLNGSDRDALYDRGIALLSLGKNAQAAGDFSRCLALAPPDSVAATQARMFLAVARLLASDRSGAMTVVQPAVSGRFSSQWPAPVFEFVAGKITAEQLFSRAQSQSEQTTARYAAAMVSLASGQSANAAKDVQWVIAHGDKRMDEYFLAVSAQRQLTQQSGTASAGKQSKH